METNTSSIGARQKAPQSSSSILKNYFSSLRLFSRNARLYLLGAFLVGINHQVFMLLFNLYLKEMSFGEGDIGRIASGRAIGMTLAAIPIAILISKIKVKPMLLIGAAMFALFRFALTEFQEFEILVGFTFLSGMAFSVFRVASGPFFMRNSTQQERTHLFSMSFAMMLFAGIVGSIIAGNLVERVAIITGDILTGYRYALYLGVGAGLCAIIPFSMIRATGPKSDERKIKFSWEKFKKRRKFYFQICLANVLIGSGAGLIIPFLPLYFHDRFDLEPNRIAFYYFLSLCGMAIGTLSGPLLSQRIGLIRSVVITQLLSIPFMLILAYTGNLFYAVPAFIIRAALMNLGVPISTNFAMELSDKDEQGLVNAFLGVSWTGGWALSVSLGGGLIEQYGYTITLNVASLLYVISALLYFVMFRKVEKRQSEDGRWCVPQVERI